MEEVILEGKTMAATILCVIYIQLFIYRMFQTVKQVSGQWQS